MTVSQPQAIALAIRLAVVLLPAVPPGVGRPSALAQPAVQGKWSDRIQHAERDDPRERSCPTARCCSGRGARPGRPRPARLHAAASGIPTQGTGTAFSETPTSRVSTCSAAATPSCPTAACSSPGGTSRDGHRVSPRRRSTTPTTNTWTHWLDPGHERRSLVSDGRHAARRGVLVSFGADKDARTRTHPAGLEGRPLEEPLDRRLQQTRRSTRGCTSSRRSGLHVRPAAVDAVPRHERHGELDVRSPGPGQSSSTNRKYAPSVLYGPTRARSCSSAAVSTAPTNAVEILDLNATPPALEAHRPDAVRTPPAQRHAAPRRHGPGHGRDPGERRIPGRRFNDLTPGQPIHSAELWDPRRPATGRRWPRQTWTAATTPPPSSCPTRPS